VSFQINTIAASYLQFVCVGPGANKSLNLWTGGGSLTGTYQWAIAAGPNHFFIVVEGPAASAGVGVTEDVTWGSSRGFFGMFALEPYFTTDTTKNNQVVAMSSNSSASKTSATSVWVAQSRSGVNWQEARLLTMKPMIQGVSAAGYQTPKAAANNLQVSFPIVVSENADGIRGRLKDIYFAGDSFSDTGDFVGVQWQESNSGGYSNIDGHTHACLYPFFLPNVATQYSPLGVPTRTTAQTSEQINGGPAILVRTSN
jgi:hypothetical protein